MQFDTLQFATLALRRRVIEIRVSTSGDRRFSFFILMFSAFRPQTDEKHECVENARLKRTLHTTVCSVDLTGRAASCP